MHEVTATVETAKMDQTARLLQLLARIIQSVQAEMERYRRIESEKAGRDIGPERAAHDWMCHHFTAWKAHHWHRAIEEAVSIEASSNAFQNPRVRPHPEPCEVCR